MRPRVAAAESGAGRRRGRHGLRAREGRNDMKTLAAALAVAALFLIPAAAANHTPAPTSVTVAGDLQSAAGCPGDWQPDCVATHLTYDAGDGVWQGTFSLPAGDYQYKA